MAFLFLLCSGIASASVQQLGPDLYAYVSENDGSANATFLVTAQGILVVDTGVNAAEGRKLLAEIRRVSNAPVRYIVNTHYHPDHRGGNRVVGPQATVISTAFTRDQRAGRDETGGATDELVFAGRLAIRLGGYDVEIFAPGPAHTRGDVFVYFPRQHAVSTGDLFLTNSCPAMDDGDMENWITALDSILALDAQAFVPGHFEVASRPQLGRFRDYLIALRDQVKAGFAAGQPLQQIQAHLALKAYDGFRQFPQYEATFADNAASYFQQLNRHRK